MTLIFCIDERCGIAFNGRRQSRDAAVCEDIVLALEGLHIEMSKYSSALFEGLTDITVTDTPSGDNAYFCELCDPTPLAHRADTLIIYKWNRIYPSDVKFTKAPASLGFTLCESTDIVGHSHERITKEIYRK